MGRPVYQNLAEKFIMSDPLLLLLDGTGMAYRAYHAIRGLKTSDGRPTNALFGFIRMLVSERRKWQPTHWVVVFDGGRPEERMALLETYKAQRKPMPPDLMAQLHLVDEFLELAGIPYILIPGKEADDLIAALAKTAEAEGWQVVIVSSDKDLLQLASEWTRVAKPGKDTEAAGPEEVKAATGVAPAQIPLWLALVGDAVDNIPGVPGIGPKKAAELVNRYGSLQGITENLDRVTPPRVQAALRESIPIIERNLELVKLNASEDPGVTLAELRVAPLDVERVKPFLEKYELRSVLKSLAEEAG